MLAKNSALCIGILTIELSFYLQSIYNLNGKKRTNMVCDVFLFFTVHDIVIPPATLQRRCHLRVTVFRGTHGCFCINSVMMILCTDVHCTDIYIYKIYNKISIKEPVNEGPEGSLQQPRFSWRLSGSQIIFDNLVHLLPTSLLNKREELYR